MKQKLPVPMGAMTMQDANVPQIVHCAIKMEVVEQARI